MTREEDVCRQLLLMADDASLTPGFKVIFAPQEIWRLLGVESLELRRLRAAGLLPDSEKKP